MKTIRIQDCETKLFLGSNNEWTSKREQARNFDNSLAAVVHCLRNNLSHAQVMVSFDTPGACDVVVPVQEDTPHFAG
jgi:hypothetical protein